MGGRVFLRASPEDESPAGAGFRRLDRLDMAALSDHYVSTNWKEDMKPVMLA